MYVRSLPTVHSSQQVTTRPQDKAYEPSQKYKEGKFILERNLLVDVQ